MALARPRRRKSPRASWETRESTRRTRKPIVIVGFGRLGGALTLGLARAGWQVSVFPRSGESVKRAAELELPIADQETLKAAAICVLAVPDAAIASVTATVLPDLGSDTLLVHCAGALGLDAFGLVAAPRPRASFHPLVAVSSPTDSLAGAAVAVSANDPGQLPLLRMMAKDLGLTPIDVPDAKRAAYHAGAVLAAGNVVALMSTAVAAFAQAGIGEADAIAALLPLAKSALRGIEHRGIAAALTGPVVRGDVDVVKRHLEALPPELRGVYRELAYRAFLLTGERHSGAVRAAFLDLLESPR